MNNSTTVGIILCWPQGGGKTTFVNELLKNNKFVNLSPDNSPQSKEELMNYYDLDALVFEVSSKKDLKSIEKMPNIAKIRLPFGIDKRWMQRPLIIVETNLTPNQIGNSLANWEVVCMDINDLQCRFDATEKIFQFILSKTK